MDVENPVIEALLQALPPLVARHRIEVFLPGILSRGHLQNLDSAGRGPRRFRRGRKIFYLRRDFVRWFLRGIEEEPPNPEAPGSSEANKKEKKNE